MKVPTAKKELRRLSIEHAENGGHIVEHQFHQSEGMYHDAETHVFGKDEGSKALAHIAEHMGMKGEKEPAAEAEHEEGAGKE
jgi:hypothetical protein